MNHTIISDTLDQMNGRAVYTGEAIYDIMSNNHDIYVDLDMTGLMKQNNRDLKFRFFLTALLKYKERDYAILVEHQDNSEMVLRYEERKDGILHFSIPKTVREEDAVKETFHQMTTPEYVPKLQGMVSVDGQNRQCLLGLVALFPQDESDYAHVVVMAMNEKEEPVDGPNGQPLTKPMRFYPKHGLNDLVADIPEHNESEYNLICRKMNDMAVKFKAMEEKTANEK